MRLTTALARDWSHVARVTRVTQIAARTALIAVATLIAAGAARGEVTFTEVGESAGIRMVHDSLGFETGDGLPIQNLYGPGVGLEDINNDGWLDLFIPNGETGNRLFLNNGDWTFTDITDEMRVGLSRVANGVAFADIDNNGLMDFALGNFYEQPQLYQHFRDNFADAADLMGLVPLLPSNSPFERLDPESMGVTFADYNEDGYVDIYVANYRDQKDVLYKSRGGGYFEFIEDVDVTYAGYGFQSVFLDFDDDGDMDIYVANDFGYNFMFRNAGPENGYLLEEVALAHGIAGGGTSVALKGMSMGLAVGDYDNDLDLDINVTNFQLNSFYRNDGESPRGPELWKWTEVAAQLGVEYPINCWGTDFVDLDNDTDLDLVQASGWIYEVRFNQPKANPDQVWLNDGPENNYKFTNITEQSGFGDTMMARGLATGDIDRDGDVDVVIVNNSFYDPLPNDPQAILYEGYSQMWRNEQNDGHNWVNLKLVGGKGLTPNGKANRAAAGARVWLTTTAGLTMMREVQAGASFMSHNSLEVEFGLAQADVEGVRVRWPGGAEEDFTGIAVNRFWILTEGEGVGTPVSVAMSSFDAVSLDRGVRLSWQMAASLPVADVDVFRAQASNPSAWTEIFDFELSLRDDGGEIFDASVVPGERYVYRVELITHDGARIESTVAEVQARGVAPDLRRAAVGQNFPNPFNPSTRIQFTVPRTMNARLVIFDARGRQVRTLFDDEVGSGTVNVDWDGQDDDGREVSSGVYVYTLVTEDGSSSRRMVLTR